jgi:hypothetical protein
MKTKTTEPRIIFLTGPAVATAERINAAFEALHAECGALKAEFMERVKALEAKTQSNLDELFYELGQEAGVTIDGERGDWAIDRTYADVGHLYLREVPQQRDPLESLRGLFDALNARAPRDGFAQPEAVN